MRFHFEHIIELPITTVFAFHENPEHLVLLHRGWTALRLIHHDGHLHHGSKTWFEITIAGLLPVALGFEHTVYEPPTRFGEQLIHGPFSTFTHFHEFVRTDAGTLAHDLLDIELPWHYGGDLAVAVLVAPILQRAFRFRRAALRTLADSGDLLQYAH